MPVAIVTGGASGIGLSITKHMVAKGWHVSIADVNETLGEQGAQALGDRVTFIRCDVTSWESQLNLFETTKKRFGRIDFVFANAGVADVPPLLNQPEDTVSKPNMRVIDICLTAAVYTIRLGLFYLRQNSGEGGRIVATASQMGIYPFPTGPLYGAAKAGLIQTVRSIAADAAKENIYVNSLCPGLTVTPILGGLEKLFESQKEILTPMENHLKVVDHLLNTNTWGATLESDAGGMFDRVAPTPWSPEHQGWLSSDKTAETWEKVFQMLDQKKS